MEDPSPAKAFTIQQNHSHVYASPLITPRYCSGKPPGRLYFSTWVNDISSNFDRPKAKTHQMGSWRADLEIWTHHRAPLNKLLPPLHASICPFECPSGRSVVHSPGIGCSFPWARGSAWAHADSTRLHLIIQSEVTCFLYLLFGKIWRQPCWHLFVEAFNMLKIATSTNRRSPAKSAGPK